MLQPDRRDILALALPSPDLDLDLDPAAVVLTAHAVRRYQERVEGVSRRIAVRRLGHLVATAQWRSRPRAWTEIVLHPGVVYGYSPDRPDVCLLLRHHAVVTVLSRRTAGWGRRAAVPQQAVGDRAGRHRSDGRRATDRRHLSPLQRCHRAAS